MQFLAHINKMALGYESDVRKDKLRVEDARKKAVEFKLQLDEAESKHSAERERATKRINDLESEAELTRAKRKEADYQILRLESGRAQRDAHIATLARQQKTEKALHKAMVKRAVKEARHETVAKFPGEGFPS